MDKPIIFSTNMVKAILAGRKTQTRRVIRSNGKPPLGEWMGEIRQGGNWITARNQSPNVSWAGFYTPNQVFYIDGEKHIDGIYYKAPAQPGDILWVRETWRPVDPNITYDGRAISYAADWNPEYFANSKKATACNGGKWKPSIHMPKSAARIWLEATNVRVERVQEITAHECILEGISSEDVLYNTPVSGDFAQYTINQFKNLWNSINAKRGYGWDSNPWVWVIEFEVI